MVVVVVVVVVRSIRRSVIYIYTYISNYRIVSGNKREKIVLLSYYRHH